MRTLDLSRYPIDNGHRVCYATGVVEIRRDDVSIAGIGEIRPALIGAHITYFGGPFHWQKIE